MIQSKKLRFRSLEEAEDELAKLQNASPKIETTGQWAVPLMLDHCAESLEFSLTTHSTLFLVLQTCHIPKRKKKHLSDYSMRLRISKPGTVKWQNILLTVN